jgi:hypothetical protein
LGGGAQGLQTNPDDKNSRHGVSLPLDGEVAQGIRKTFAAFRPQKIVETGTFLGTGSTTIIASTLRDLSYPATFYSIECNPDYYHAARDNLAASGLIQYVNLLNGLSIPRSLLPSSDEIQRLLASCPANVFDDFQKSKGGEGYLREVDFPEVQDDLLRDVMSRFDHRPDFVLLDSAGHIGFIEFKYILSLLKGPCFIALDDAETHLKHYHSLRYIDLNTNFRPVLQTSERYGFVIFYYEP